MTNVYFECTKENLDTLKAILNEVKDIYYICDYDIDESGLYCGHFDIDCTKHKFIKK